ncbi:MAG: thiamine diphosphokinase [Pseudomonadota bacterium]
MMNTNPESIVATVHAKEPITLLGASSVSAQDIEEILKLAPTVVAADGGAGIALEHGITPEFVIGDFDSLPHFATERLTADQLVHIAEQDSTDFEKCLARIDAPLILALGFTGWRLDHELAVMNALVRYPKKRCVLVGSHDVVFHAPRRLRLDLPLGCRVSLFPLAPLSGRSSGLRWPIDGIAFSPNGPIGTSNEATGPVELSFSQNGMLVLLPRDALGPTLRALLSG